jgi:carboxyl-terminal processing protease
MKMKKTLLAALVVASAAVLAPLYGPGILARAATPAGDDLDPAVKAVTSAYALVEQNAAEPVNAESTFYAGVIPGMLHALDPHSNFIEPKEYKEMMRKQMAHYYGVGMQITVDGPKVVVMEPFPGSPAANADLRRGDWVYAVDGKQTCSDPCTAANAMDTGQVADMLRGPRGTQVRVTVKREGGEPYTTTVTRDAIETSVVDVFWLKPGVAYLGVSSFEASNIERDVQMGMKALDESKVNSLILDLRENLGGLVNEAVFLAGRFLRDGQVIVSQRGRMPGADETYKAKAKDSKDPALKYPIIVLVNRNSASASEIVSGALQDHDRALVMGETTFGKGLVQQQVQMEDGSALLLTIAHYYTPSGRLIQRDYSHSSMMEYYNARPKTDGPASTDDVKSTDSGRKVYGGGGITPDEKYPPLKANVFQRHVLMLSNAALPLQDAFWHFAESYFGPRKPAVGSETWTPDADVLSRFKDFLRSKGLTFTDAEFTSNQDWMRDRIRWEFLFRAYNKKVANQGKNQTDAEVLAAIDNMPKAEALHKESNRAYAMRAAK